jgi:hypothetical protein
LIRGSLIRGGGVPGDGKQSASGWGARCSGRDGQTGWRPQLDRRTRDGCAMMRSRAAARLLSGLIPDLPRGNVPAPRPAALRTDSTRAGRFGGLQAPGPSRPRQLGRRQLQPGQRRPGQPDHGPDRSRPHQPGRRRFGQQQSGELPSGRQRSLAVSARPAGQGTRLAPACRGCRLSSWCSRCSAAVSSAC